MMGILDDMLKYLGLMTTLLLAAIPLQAADCERLVEKSDEIAIMRDRNPERGAEQGFAELANLEQAEMVCPVAQALLHRAVAMNLHILGRIPEALEQIDSARDLVENAVSAMPEQVAKIHLTAGVLSWASDAHDEALAHYFEALAASRRADDLVGIGRALGNIGNLYSTMGDYQRALDSQKRALISFERADKVTDMAGSLVNLAALSRHLATQAESVGDLDGAQSAYTQMREYSLEALARFRTLNNPRGIAYASANAAESLEGLERPQAALDFHRQALELQQELGDESGQVQSLIGMARTNITLERYARAAELLSQAQEFGASENLGVAVVIETLQVAVAEGRGDFASALAHQKALTELQRQIGKTQMAARVEEVRLETESERREQVIDLLRSEAEIVELQLERQQALLIVAALVGVLLLGLLAALYLRYRLRVKTSRQLDIASRTDPLTGLSNRRDMMERLEAAGAETREGGAEHGLILADIDDFKHVNDHYGHSVGDEVLTNIARLMAGSVKGKDTICRWGGEEFLILLPHTETRGAVAVAENLRRAVADHPIETSKRNFEISISLGVAPLNRQATVDQAITRADRAMYRAKQAGKNRFRKAD